MNSLKNGKGILFDAHGKVLYEGYWKENLFHGKGKIHYSKN